jgi:hypothetical protein
VLNRFNKSVKDESNGDSPFYQASDVNGKRVARVHSVVEHWINHMENDASCKAGITALGDLLNIVKTGLLVVKLPKEGGTFSDDNTQQPDGQRLLTQIGRETTADQISAPQPQNTTASQNTPTTVLPSFQLDLVDGDDDFELDFGAPRRFRATTLFVQLERVMYTDEVEGYWHGSQTRRPPPTDFEASFVASTITDKKNYEPPQGGLSVIDSKPIDYGDDPNLDPNIWESEVDNEFASSLSPAFNDMNRSVSGTQVSLNLCHKCEGFRDRIWNPGFKIIYRVQDLIASVGKRECDLCCLLWRTCERNLGTSVPTAQFERNGSVLMMNGGSVPVLSLFRSPGKPTPRS